MATGKQAKKMKIKFDADALKPALARRIFLELLKRNPDLLEQVAALAQEFSDKPILEDMTDEIFSALIEIDEEAITAVSGKTWRGYREAEEAAPELLSEALEPFFDELIEYGKSKKTENSLIVCQAIVWALYRYQQSDEFAEVEDYLQDVVEETASWALKLWQADGDATRADTKMGNVERKLPELFVSKKVPKWNWLLK